MAAEPLFRSFFMGGIESSSHRLGWGKRLDMLTAIHHDRFALQDYRRLQQQDIRTVRGGIRWHLIEPTPGHYDFSSVLPMLRASQQAGTQIIWDVCHYGWPEDIDIFTPQFVTRFARLSEAFARFLADESDETPFICPINEISFFSWGGGDAGYLNPFQRGRGFELKVQLVRAAIEGIEAFWNVLPQARIVHVDPIIHIHTAHDRPHEHWAAEGHRVAQYQAWDMLCGTLWPQVGGQEKYLDIIGVNYYSNNQWIHGGPTLDYRDPIYRPFHNILMEVYERYQRPMFIAETGIENEMRPEWLRYIASEAAIALQNGIPLEALCLYPIFNHPGWDDERHCHNGLWDYADESGNRSLYQPLADELHRQQTVIESVQRARQQHQIDHITRARQIIHDEVGARICLFTDSLEASGLGEHMLTLAAELCKTHAITLVMPPSAHNEAFLTRARQLPIVVLSLEVRGQGREPWEALRDFLRDQDIEIFHSHAGIGWEGHDGFYAAYFAEVPICIRTEHLPYKLTDPYQKFLYDQLAAKASRIICVSDEARASFIEAGVPAEKLSTVRNGISVSPSKVKPSQVYANLNLPANAQLILTASRLTEQKGHAYLLDAIPGILTACPDAYFVWAGDGPLAQVMQDQIAERGLQGRVKLLGWRDDVHDLLNAATLLVLPSLFEGLPLTMLEALASNIPVVATRVGGIPEAITDRVEGRLVPAADAETLGSAIIEALQQPALRKAWAIAGRTRFEQNFNAARMARDTAAVYKRALADGFPQPQESFNVLTESAARR